MEQDNKTFQVIIAHPIPDEGQRIARLLEQSGRFSICYMTHNGQDCFQKVLALEPDLVLVHAILETIDGLEVLQRLRVIASKTKQIYITNYNGYLARYAEMVGDEHCILMPCPDDLLLSRTLELVLPPRLCATDEEIDTHTARILQDIGAPNNMKGYYYTLDAVRILVRDPELVMRRAVTTELYKAVAQRYGAENDSQVERCLRTLTDHIFMHSSVQLLRQYFTLADIQRSHIKNTVFLTTVAKQVTRALQPPRQDEERDAQED